MAKKSVYISPSSPTGKRIAKLKKKRDALNPRMKSSREGFSKEIDDLRKREENKAADQARKGVSAETEKAERLSGVPKGGSTRTGMTEVEKIGYSLLAGGPAAKAASLVLKGVFNTPAALKAMPAALKAAQKELPKLQKLVSKEAKAAAKQLKNIINVLRGKVKVTELKAAAPKTGTAGRMVTRAGRCEGKIPESVAKAADKIAKSQNIAVKIGKSATGKTVVGTLSIGGVIWYILSDDKDAVSEKEAEAVLAEKTTPAVVVKDPDEKDTTKTSKPPENRKVPPSILERKDQMGASRKTAKKEPKKREWKKGLDPVTVFVEELLDLKRTEEEIKEQMKETKRLTSRDLLRGGGRIRKKSITPRNTKMYAMNRGGKVASVRKPTRA